MARKKKKSHTLLKVALGTGLVLGAAYYNIKKIFWDGHPIKRAIFLTTASALMLYNCHGDKIDKLGKSVYNGIDHIFNNPIRVENTYLEKKLELNGILVDSLNNILKEKNKYITTQENKNKKPEIKISEYELKIKEEPKKVKDLKISNYDNEKNLKRALEKTMKSASANIYWIPISKGETLSSISKELTGKAENYLILAKLNSINDPSDIPVGFPLKIPKEYSNNSRVRYDNYPEKTMIMKRGQSIDDFVKNTLHIKSKIPSTIENILKYNMKLGNKIPVNGYSDLREAVVYIGD